MSSTSPPHALHFLLVLCSGWGNRQQQQVIDYLMEETRILREQLAQGCHHDDEVAAVKSLSLCLFVKSYITYKKVEGELK